MRAIRTALERAGLSVSDVDLLHSFAGVNGLAEAIDEVPLTVSFSAREDEYSAHAKFHCPNHHQLESWSDAEPVAVRAVSPTGRPGAAVAVRVPVARLAR